MPEHPLLPDPTRIDSRRAAGSGGSGVSRNPRRHGQQLSQSLSSVQGQRRLDPGIDPDLVFKIRAAHRRIEDDTLISRGLTPLVETADYTYFVLSQDDGAKFRKALNDYGKAADRIGAKAKLSSLFGLIDEIEPYGPSDRRGVGIDALPDEGPFILDVTIWAAADYAEASRRAATLERVILESEGEVLLRSVTVRRTVMRVRVERPTLDDILDTSVVEQVRTPPVPFMDPSDWRHSSVGGLQVAELPGGDVGVLDDAADALHPLLAGRVTNSIEAAPTGYSWQASTTHGSLVTGRVLFPQLHEELRDGLPLTAIGAVHVARVLEAIPGEPKRTRFPVGLFPHETVELAIRGLHADHGIRVFNLSVGYDDAYDGSHVGELTETLDDLIRELGIIIVVPTGNVPSRADDKTITGHDAGRQYPQYMNDPLWRLAEPAPAALAVTVGAIAHSDAPEERTPPRIGDRAVAPVGHAAPFSRVGPGIGSAADRLNKPEFVHEGGNWVVTDTGTLTALDAGTSVISTAVTPSGGLFSACVGTSFAAPAVTRVAADIAHAYPEASANLVRALLCSSAQLPAGGAGLSGPERFRRYGWGQPSSDRAMTSGSRRTTMTFDGAMPVDTVVIHPVPMPEAFIRGTSATRRIMAALAFDPPVRRQRREYLAGIVQLDLYRAVEVDELIDILQKQDPDDPQDRIKDRRRVTALLPGVNSFKASTLQQRVWESTRPNVDDGDVYFLAVTHRAQTWARDWSSYKSQGYALAVTLEDEGRADIDIHSLVTQQIHLPARIRVRA